MDKNVAIVVTDCLRLDRAVKMDAFAELQTQGAFFTNAHAVAHCSDPNFVSMLTGLHVDSHKVYTNYPRSMPYSGPFLQELLKENGYETAFLGFRWGDEVKAGQDSTAHVYWKGWDNSDLFTVNESQRIDVISRLLQEVVSGPSPWFVMVRLMHLHEPFHSYDTTAERLDRDLKPVLGLLEDAFILVLVSDHGQEIGWHEGYLGHNYHLWEGLIRVPLAIRCPRFAPRTIGKFVQHQDLLITICDLAGIEPPMVGGGRNLVPLMAGHDIRWREEIHCGGIGVGAKLRGWKHRSVRRGDYKLIRGVHREEGREELLFNVGADPNEARPIQDPEMKGSLSHAMDKWMKEHGVDELFEVGLTAAEEQEILERLRGVGYID